MESSQHSQLSKNYAAEFGSFDEWKNSQNLGEQWSALIESLDELGNEGVSDLQRQGDELLKDNGRGEQAEDQLLARQLSLDPIPVLLSEKDYLFVLKAVGQRAKLLNAILKDCYSEQKLLKDGLLHPSLLFKQSSHIRAMVDALPEDREYLNFYATDLGRTADGEWVVLKDHTQMPLGLGIALENRVVTSNLYRDLLKDFRLIRLVHFFQSYRDTIYSHAPSGVDEPLVVMLSPKAKEPAHTEDVYLSRYLGISIVDGGELTVRDDRVYLKSVSGLMRVHVIIRRIQEEEADPLATPSYSYNGVPGLIHVMRTGNVAVLNPPGTGILEIAELYPTLPQLSQSILGEDLLIPSFKESQTSCSSSPIWTGDALEAHPIKMRFFSYYDGENYRVMEGGLALYESPDQPNTILSKDIWVLANEDTEVTQHISFRQQTQRIKRTTGLLSSRAADNLYWIGRYSERSESVTRMILEIVLNITEEGQRGGQAPVKLLLSVLELGGFLPKGRAEKLASDETSELFETLCEVFYKGESSQTQANTVPHAMSQLASLASLSRARLSNGLFHIIREIEKVLQTKHSQDFIDLRTSLYDVILNFSAFNGTCLSNLTRTRGWHFITIGKGIENVSWLVSLVQNTLNHYPEVPSSLLDSILSVNDTTLTYRFRYQSRPELGTVLDLILFDPMNPRSLYSQLKNVHESLEILESSKVGMNRPVDLTVRRALNFLDTEIVSYNSDEDFHESVVSIGEFLDWMMKEIPQISEKLGWEFFTHVDYHSS